MLVKNVMTKKVVALRPHETLEIALSKLVKHNISGAPVIDEKGHVVGVVTESDIINAIDAYNPKIHYDNDSGFAVILAVLKHKEKFDAIKKEIIGSQKFLVEDFMEKDILTIEPEKTISDAARLMSKFKVKRLPVVKDKKLIGIISRADIIRALGR